ncbi:hypothetical protein [Anaeroselena agilis]|uniref:EamA domain-containing protein n=1 Tax=Anaeroselena agilis TaxID=3063788 RepID=A0ABU3NXT8_9FIRM|nr:hypothetical protein [Selenomonadales bacterium 4137-cl]
MMLYYMAIGLTVVSNVLYHVFLKVTPATVNPILSLVVTYLTAASATAAIYFLSPDKVSLTTGLRELNWASYALGLAIVGLEVGFMLAYRAGWNITLAGLVSSTTVSLLLIPVGLLFFRESLTAVNALGIALCLAGLVLVNYKG